MTEYHPIANIFPLLSDDNLQSLADDITQHGLKEPVMLFEDKILDGRNRWRACKLADIEPDVEEFEGTYLEAVSHVWSLNAQRRQLDSSQAAMAQVNLEKVCPEYAHQLATLREKQQQLTET